MKTKGTALIALVLVFVLAGCSSMGSIMSDDNAKEGGGGVKDISLEVWTFLDYNIPGDYYKTTWEKLAKEYGYEIDVRTYSKQQIQDKLRIAVASKELPDIFTVYGGTYPDFLFDAQACAPVQDFLEGSDSLFKDSYINPYKDGNNYTIPCFPEAYFVLYANTKLMNEIGIKSPATWEELVDAVEKVKKYNKRNGTNYAAIELGAKDSWLGELFYSSVVNSINPLAINEDYSKIDALDEKVFRQAAKKVEYLANIGAFENNYIEIGETEAMESFINSNAVFFPHQSTLLYYLMEQMGEEAFEMLCFPSCNKKYEDDYNRYLVAVNYTLKPGLCISAYSKYRSQAANLSIEYAKEVNRINVEEYGYTDITRKNLVTPAVLPYPVQWLKERIFYLRHESPDVLAVLPSEKTSSYLNITKRLYAGEYDNGQFIKAVKKLLR